MTSLKRDHCILGQGNIHEQEARATGRQCGSLAGAGETKNFCQRLALKRGKNGIAVGTKYFDLLECNFQDFTGGRGGVGIYVIR